MRELCVCAITKQLLRYGPRCTEFQSRMVLETLNPKPKYLEISPHKLDTGSNSLMAKNLPLGARCLNEQCGPIGLDLWLRASVFWRLGLKN